MRRTCSGRYWRGSRRPTEGSVEVLAVDIGNSGAHLGAFSEGKLVWRATFPQDEPDRALREVPVGIEGAVLGSVVRGARELWAEALERSLGLEPLVASGRSDWGLMVLYDDPESVGVDRLSAASEAYRTVGGRVVVVDVGTAITVDAVSDDGTFLGGIIAPGPRLMASALHEGTSLLPPTEPEPGADLLGRSTEDCIRSGLLHGTASLVDGLVGRVRRKLGGAKVVATGGGLDFVLPALEVRPEVVEPDLVLKGLYRLFVRERG